MLTRFLPVRRLLPVSPALQLRHPCVPSLSRDWRGAVGAGCEEIVRASLVRSVAHCVLVSELNETGGGGSRRLCAAERSARAACRVCVACRSRKVGECALELHDLDFLRGELQSFNLLDAASRATKNPVRPLHENGRNAVAMAFSLLIRGVTCAARVASSRSLRPSLFFSSLRVPSFSPRCQCFRACN